MVTSREVLILKELLKSPPTSLCQAPDSRKIKVIENPEAEHQSLAVVSRDLLHAASNPSI
jgi:hypothetical protein